MRSISGRSLREFAGSALPEDLSPFRPPEAGRNAVRKFLVHAGFKVYIADSGLTISIEGPPHCFADTFGASEAQIIGISAHETVVLSVPEEIREFVEEIVVLPKPEFF